MTVFSQISWQGGICNDEYLADSTQFSDCEDINIYESSGYIKLWPKKTTTNNVGWPNYYCSGTGKNSAWTAIVYIAWETADWVDWAFANVSDSTSFITSSIVWPIRGLWVVNNLAWVWTGTGFIITNKGGLFTWSYDAGTGTYWNFTNAWLTSRKANGTNTTEYAPYIIVGSFLYYAYKNVIRCFNTTTFTERFASGSAVDPIITIDPAFEITNLMSRGTQFIFYANDWFNSRKYFWDGITNAIQENIPYPAKKIVNVANFGNYEVALYETANQYSIGYIDWYDTKPIFSSDLPWDTTRRGFQWFINNSLYELTLGDNIISFIADSNTYYSLGSFKPWKPFALSRFNHNLSWAINLVQWDWYINNFYSYIGSWSSNNQALSLSDSEFDSAGYVITNPIKWRAVSLKKSAKKVMYWYELQTGSTIKVYYQFDKNDTEQSSLNWTLLDTITVGTDFPDGMGYRAINLDGKFNIARFKIQLETSNSSYSPKLFDFHFEYDETNAEL